MSREPASAGSAKPSPPVDPADAVRARGMAPGGLRREACPLCGSTDLRPILDLRGRTLLRCAGCGVKCTDEYGEGAPVAAYYDAVPAHAGKVDDLGGEAALTAIARSQADAMEAMCGPRRHGTYLEVGCSRGHLLAEMELRGWEVTGIEVAQSSAEEAQARLKAGGVLVATPEDSGLRPASFDRVAMFDVLAHLPHPVETLEALGELLKPGGTLVLSTVDEDWPLVPLFLELFRQLPEETAGLRDEMYEGQHYCYFGRSTIGRLLADAGLELVDVRPLEPLSARYFVHQYGWRRRLALAGMRRLDKLMRSSRKMLVQARRPR